MFYQLYFSSHEHYVGGLLSKLLHATTDVDSSRLKFEWIVSQGWEFK